LRGSNTGPLDWDRRCICPACFPAQSFRSHHPPSMRARPAIPIGRNLNNSARVASTPHSTNPACSYDMCAFENCFSRLSSSRFVSGAWLAPFTRRGGATDRIANSPELWRAATSASMCEWPTMPTGFAGRSWPSCLSSPSGHADGTGALDTNTWPACDQKQYPVT
jgi:hypothetical protein